MRAVFEKETIEAQTAESMRQFERLAADEGLRRKQLAGRIPESARKTIDSKMDEADALYADGSRILSGKLFEIRKDHAGVTALRINNDTYTGGFTRVEFYDGITLMGRLQFDNDGNMKLSTDVAGKGIVLATGADITAVVIDENGKVGVNENNPQDRVEVNGAVLIKDKLKLTQDDGNEYIDSLDDGYIDIAATTSIRIGNGDKTNYLEIKADGEINLHGTARVRKHLVIGAASWHPGASAPADSDIGIVHTLAFDSTSDDEAHYTLLVPHDLVTGSEIVIDVDWGYSGSADNGTVCWAFEYKSIAPNEAIVGGTTTTSETTAGNHTSGNLNRVTFTTGIIGAVGHEILALHFTRDVSEDTLSTDAEMVAVHLSYLSNRLGETT